MSGREFELLVRGGALADGTGAPLRRRDLGITAGTVTVLPADAAATATRVLDATGQVVAPGFVDAHTHSDLTTLDGTGEEQAHAAVLQGVTVELCGNCGNSAFPGAHRDFGAFARAHTATGRANHLATLVGHGTVRAAVVGHEDRVATRAELTEMCRLLDEALTAGAAGLSSGLIYTPGSYADTVELTVLASVAARHRKPYVTHLRDEMSQVEAALDEAVRIARASGAPLHVSHHKTAGKHAWGGTLRTVPRLNRLRASGLDVTCDVYPYTAGSTALAAMLPPWAHDGGVELLLKRLDDPASRARMRASIAEGVPGWENTVGNGGWDRISVAGAARHPELQGRYIADIAAQRGADALDVVAELLLAEGGDVTIISHSMREDDVQRVLTAPFSMIGSDGVPRPGLPHPRWSGTFARVLGRYTRELGLLTLPDAVRKMTGATAARFGLTGRGVLRDGAAADLVVFDPATVADRATFAEPLLPPTGIQYVVVDGTVVVEDGAVTGARPGKVLAC